MSAEPVAPVVHLKRHEMVAAALADAKLKQAMRPAVTPAVRPARAHPKDHRAHARRSNPTVSATPASAQ